MKVRYIHSCEPGRVRIHDTVKAYLGSIGFIHGLRSDITQEQYDREELQRFARDREKGIILSFEVVDYQSKVRSTNA